MPRPKRDFNRVVYAESSSSSTTANPQVPSVVPPIVIRPPSRSQSGSVVPPAAGRSGSFFVESFVRPSSPVRSAFHPFVPTAVPQPPPASPSERGQSVGCMPALVPIFPPTLVASSSSDDGFPPPLVSSEGSSRFFEPYDFETQHLLKANYLATLLTSYTTQELIAGYYTFRRQMDAHLSTLSQDDQYRLLPPHRDN
ncbi:hypothetical protein DAPPUDRAFT_116856 [Daphnia pulex]|uniref:Uncharacterized protein n=1 Tax=Daphnia pulex TaxID=6669 RepID=E9HQR9_DAPPU|nr:hypothetical protein DAPPUDRAFT_116856 [Daphnia pulex]|eukprot:EFX65915.1 hypothetical protein DAPPUDRAFT_116856 [Daphnia pulex]